MHTRHNNAPPRMNIFQLIADLLHLTSIVALLYMLHRNKNCYGVSLKTQCLFLTVFCTRYLDLFVYYISLYNECMKILFICATGATVFLMTTKLKASYDKSLDSMKVHYLVAPCFVLALLWNENYSHDFFSFHNIRLVLWAFSQFLEAVAILPQLIMISRPGGNIANLTYLYIFCMGLYRGLYILNWIYKCGTSSKIASFCPSPLIQVHDARRSDLDFCLRWGCADSPLQQLLSPLLQLR